MRKRIIWIGRNGPGSSKGGGTVLENGALKRGKHTNISVNMDSVLINKFFDTRPSLFRATSFQRTKMH